MRTRIAWLSFVAGLFWSVAALAVPITYIYTGTGSGSIGPTSFTGAAFTITGQADTDDIASCGFDCSYIDHLATTVEIAGVGTFTITSSLRTFLSGDVVGLSRGGSSGADLYNLGGAFGGWDLVSAIGPVSITGSLMQWTSSPVNTSGGVLAFNNAGGVPGTFQATFAPPVPTLGGLSALLLCLTLVGIAGWRLRGARGNA